jgi:hypothetical protein
VNEKLHIVLAAVTVPLLLAAAAYLLYLGATLGPMRVVLAAFLTAPLAAGSAYSFYLGATQQDFPWCRGDREDAAA